MSKRKLSKDEETLWKKVAQTADPLHVSRKSFQTEVEQAPLLPREATVTSDPAPLPAFEIGSNQRGAAPVGNNLAPTLSERLSDAPVQMDQKAFQRLKRGKLFPEARIDLHGMTLDQAHPALIGFIMRSYGEGKRLVLVITGKGKHRDDGGPIPVRFGVLKHQVPQWLRMAPIAGMVLQVTEAHGKHGGAGAYYVYLRRPRSVRGR